MQLATATATPAPRTDMSSTPPAWTDSAVDQRIVDSLMADDTKVFVELAQRGVAEAAVRARARVIGMTRQFIKDCRLAGSRPALRQCVGCEHTFLSAGVHNRMCRRCLPR